MLRSLAPALLAAFILVTGVPVSAQTPEYTGIWACEFSYTEFNQRNERTAGHTRSFTLVVLPNGRFQATGTVSSIAGVAMFRSEGAWQIEDGHLVADGPDSSFPGMVFGFAGLLQPNGMLAYQYEQRDPTNSYVMSRSNYLCNRLG